MGNIELTKRQTWGTGALISAGWPVRVADSDIYTYIYIGGWFLLRLNMGKDIYICIPY